jgi:hypothetical protein
MEETPPLLSSLFVGHSARLQQQGRQGTGEVRLAAGQGGGRPCSSVPLSIHSTMVYCLNSISSSILAGQPYGRAMSYIPTLDLLLRM